MVTANVVITPSVIAKEALMQLENNMVMGNLVHRAYKKEFVKVGSTVSIRKPVKFVASDGATRVAQNVLESTTSIVVSTQKHVSWAFSSQDLTLTIEEYSERYIKPACIALANAVDVSLCSLYKDVPDAVGTAGVTPATFAALALAGQKLDENAVPKADRNLVLNPAAEWALADGLKGVYQNEIVKAIIREAYLGRVGKFDIAGDQNIQNHTKGTSSEGITLKTTMTDGSGACVLTGGDEGETIVAGDIITFAGHYAVNPVSGASYSYLKQFTVTTGGTFAASTDVSLVISPAPTIVGAYKNVSTLPVATAAVVILGSHVANLAFHKNAFALVMLPMEMPEGAAFKARETYNNLSIRIIRDYNIDADEDVIRLDILYGVKVLYSELAVRLLG